jgi:hypothetical protein
VSDKPLDIGELAPALCWKPETMVALVWIYFDAPWPGALTRVILSGVAAPWQILRDLDSCYRAKLMAQCGDKFVLAAFLGAVRRIRPEICMFRYADYCTAGMARRMNKTGFHGAFAHFNRLCAEHNTRGSIIFHKPANVRGKTIGWFFDHADWENMESYSVSFGPARTILCMTETGAAA